MGLLFVLPAWVCACSRDGFCYNGANEAVNYRSKASYFVIRPK